MNKGVDACMLFSKKAYESIMSVSITCSLRRVSGLILLLVRREKQGTEGKQCGAVDCGKRWSSGSFCILQKTLVDFIILIRL